jgi:hypothetical protein
VEGQSDDEGRTVARRRFNSDLASVGAHDIPAYRQAEAASVRGRPSNSVGAEEAIEKPWNLLG